MIGLLVFALLLGAAIGALIVSLFAARSYERGLDDAGLDRDDRPIPYRVVAQ